MYEAAFRVEVSFFLIGCQVTVSIYGIRFYIMLVLFVLFHFGLDVFCITFRIFFSFVELCFCFFLILFCLIRHLILVVFSLFCRFGLHILCILLRIFFCFCILFLRFILIFLSFFAYFILYILGVFFRIFLRLVVLVHYRISVIFFREFFNC